MVKRIGDSENENQDVMENKIMQVLEEMEIQTDSDKDVEELTRM